MKPKISVTVITYNHEKFLASCLESILAQQVDFPYEVVLSDDCSTDGTKDIIRTYAQRHGSIIYPLYHDGNVGAIRNFRDANAACRGEYIAHIDGDDIMLPGKLQKQADFLDGHPECSIVCHDLKVFDDASGDTLYYFNETYKKAISTIDDLIMRGTFFGHSSKMFRTSSLPEEGIDLRTEHVGDWLFHIQNARKGKIGYIDEVLGGWRISANTMTRHNARKRLQALNDMDYTLQKAAGYTANTYAVRYGYAKLYFLYAYEHLVRGDMKACAGTILRIIGNGIFFPVLRDLLRQRRHAPPGPGPRRQK